MKIFLTFLLLVMAFSSCQKVPAPANEFHWKPYSEQAIKESVAQHKPVVIDFFADWCPICHELDRSLFSRPDIKAKLAKVTALRFDATNQDDPNIQRILQQYDIEGLPTIVFLNTHGVEIDNSRIIGFVTPHDFDEVFALLGIFK